MLAEAMEAWRAAIAAWLPAGRGPWVAGEPSAGMRAQAVRAHPHPGVAWVAGRAERLPLRDASCALA